MSYTGYAYMYNNFIINAYIPIRVKHKLQIQIVVKYM